MKRVAYGLDAGVIATGFANGVNVFIDQTEDESDSFYLVVKALNGAKPWYDRIGLPAAMRT